MAVPALATAPVLSTPDTHIFEDPTPAVDGANLVRLSDEQVALTYEIERTVREIKEGRWKRIALQFPDQMLIDAPRVYEQLSRGLERARMAQHGTTEDDEEPSAKLQDMAITEEEEKDQKERLFILGDTSYGACCVDEVAAEHVDADVVVHYGRSCLSPPSRLPVIYVFTERSLDLDPLLATFKQTYPDHSHKIILMADIPYAHHIPALHTRLQEAGYTSLHATEIVHDPSSLLPNRTTPPDAQEAEALRDYALFHISNPPTSLLLTLSSRVSSIHIYPTDAAPTATLASTSMTLRRRYALLTSLSTTPIFGILINTLSVKNYLHILSHVQASIAAAGKKSYTFVVGKVNAAKVANFSEVGGWVVIGCWESSLIESRDFWRPVITPFELGLALKDDGERVWTGEWTGDFMAVLAEKDKLGSVGAKKEVEKEEKDDADADEYDSEEESAPPEFDLRTGRYVSHSRPMREPKETPSQQQQQQQQVEGEKPARESTALTKRATGELASIGGVVSPGAEYLRSQRTWQGLGSDYKDEEGQNPAINGHAATMEEGRSGIARGYVVGDEGRRH